MFRNANILLGITLGLTGAIAAQETPAQNFTQTVAAIEQTLQANHYNPKELNSLEYKTVISRVRELASTASDKKLFITGFNDVWRSGPFSHVHLSQARGSADQLAEHLDNMDVDDGSVTLAWQGGVAVLTVTTMMGQNTIKNIEAAYKSINQAPTKALIIDLRANKGGAFAIRPLIEHVIDQPFDAGSFIAQNWHKETDRAPQKQDVAEIEPWDGWSIRTFWNDMHTARLVRIHFQPKAPSYRGPLYVLTSNQTASAAELAADTLKASGRATLVGEKTAGQMLSQKLFDIAGGFHLYLPIADYYSAKNGRIEGAGVAPHTAVSHENALETALDLIANKERTEKQALHSVP